MAFADILRSRVFTGNDIADLIEGILVSGFPLNWTSWAPTYAAGGSMTFTGVTTINAEYVRIGSLVVYHIHATGTIGGTPSATLNFTLPVNQSTTIFHVAGCQAIDVNLVGGFTSHGGTTKMDVYRYDSGNWNAAASRGFNISGIYRAA